MLVLSRKQGTAVAVGNFGVGECVVKVTVLAIRGLQVKLGFEAPSNIAVHRWEVWQRICSETTAPVSLAPQLEESKDSVGS